MIELDQFQKEAIASIDQQLDVLVVAPTGSGKTLIAEHAINQCIQQGSKILYTTPIKALSNQKYNDFKDMYGDSVGILTGDRNINKDASILVLTTEILRNMIFTNDASLADIGAVVLDEVHYLGDRDRGNVWEEVIIHLPLDITIVYLSATIANAEEFQEWIVSLRGPTDLIISNKRPVPLRTHLVTLNRGTQNIDNIFQMNSDEYHSENKLLSKLNKYYKSHYKKEFIKPSLEEMREYLLLTDSTPSIFFVFSREKTEIFSRRIANDYRKRRDTTKLHKIISPIFDNLTIEEKDLLNYDEILWMWTRGVSYHHAGMVPLIKETVELLFIEGLIDILFATETLSLGINMPAKSVVISSIHKYDGFLTRPINQNEFMQLTGRAGRRGIDEKGQAYIFFDKSINAEWYPNIFNVKSNNLNSQFSLSFSSIVGFTGLYKKDDALLTLQKSFWAYQNNKKIEILNSDFNNKYNFLTNFKFINRSGPTETGDTLLALSRDSFIPSIILMENINRDDLKLEEALAIICQGMSREITATNIPKSLNAIRNRLGNYIKECNKELLKNNEAEYFKEHFYSFGFLYHFIENSSINDTLDQFDISPGDFIKEAKEALEIASKFSEVYNLDIFNKIIKKLDIGLISKTIYE